MKRAMVTATVVVLALGLAGCGGYYYAEYEHPPVEGAVIVEAPPAPLVEEVYDPPFVGAVWVAGYWHWTGHRYSWVGGRWMRPPRAGVLWYPGGYVRRGRGYVWVGGRWAARGYTPRYRYVHPRHHVHGYHRAPSRGGVHYRTYRGGRPAPARPHRGAPPARYGPHRAPPAAHGAPPQGKRRKDNKHRAPAAGRGPARHRAPPAR